MIKALFMFWYQQDLNMLREILNINQTEIPGQIPSFFMKWKFKKKQKKPLGKEYPSIHLKMSHRVKKCIHLSPCKRLIKSDGFITKDTLL